MKHPFIVAAATWLVLLTALATRGCTPAPAPTGELDVEPLATTNTLAMFTGPGSVGDSPIAYNGTTLLTTTKGVAAASLTANATPASGAGDVEATTVNGAGGNLGIGAHVRIVGSTGELDTDGPISASRATLNGTPPTGAGDLEATTAHVAGDIDTSAGGRITANGNLLSGGAIVFNNLSSSSRETLVGGLPTVNHGTLSLDASNAIGRVAAIGANNSVTLTLSGGGFGSYCHCQATAIYSGSGQGFQLMGDGSPTAPTFTCFDMTSGVAGNCPDFDYECWGH